MARQLNCMRPGISTENTFRTLFSCVQSSDGGLDASSGGGEKSGAFMDDDADEMNFEGTVCALSDFFVNISVEDSF